MSQSKYKLATGFPVIALTYSEYVHLQFARQRQPGDWIEWPSMGRDTRQMLSHLLDVEKVRFIGQRNDGAIRIIVKEPGNAFPGAGARRLIVSLVASFIWFAVDVAILNAALEEMR